MLIQQLHELKSDGIVNRRKVFQEIPPKVEYSLTRHGATLKLVLEPLCEWSRKHMARRELEQQLQGKRATELRVRERPAGSHGMRTRAVDDTA